MLAPRRQVARFGELLPISEKGQGPSWPAGWWHSRSTPSSGNSRCVPALTLRANLDSRTAAQIILFDHLVGGHEQIERDASRRNAALQRAGAKDIAPPSEHRAKRCSLIRELPRRDMPKSHPSKMQRYCRRQAIIPKVNLRLFCG